MAEKLPTSLDEVTLKYCPQCGPGAGYMEVLLFLGITPEGYGCRSCDGLYDLEDGERRMATMIGL